MHHFAWSSNIIHSLYRTHFLKLTGHEHGYNSFLNWFGKSYWVSMILEHYSALERISRSVYNPCSQKAHLVGMEPTIKHIWREFLNNNSRIFCGFWKLILEVFSYLTGTIQFITRFFLEKKFPLKISIAYWEGHFIRAGITVSWRTQFRVLHWGIFSSWCYYKNISQIFILVRLYMVLWPCLAWKHLVLWRHRELISQGQRFIK